jgi:GNAT superfamily N-acetyltransferase
MQVRQITATELNELLSLYRYLHEQDDPRPSDAEVQATWQELLENPRYRYLGAYADEQLVSSCAITIIPNLTRGCRPYGVIENVVTHAGFRGRGYGKAVVAEALSFAWASGCYKVMLLTGRKDEATFRFYETAGFDRHEKQAFIAKPMAMTQPRR